MSTLPNSRIMNRALLKVKSGLTQRAPDPSTGSGTAGGSLRVFRQFAWLEVGSVNMAFSRPTHQRVTPAVGAPSEAWCFLQGERPCRIRPNQPIVPSVAVMKEYANTGLRMTVE